MDKFVPKSRTLPRLLDEVAEALPDHEALVTAVERVTYANLRQRCLELAKGLYALGVKRGDKVAILMGNRAEWIDSVLAITSLGAVAVGLNTWSSRDELEYLLDHSDASVLIAAPRYLKQNFGVMVEELRMSGHLPGLTHIIAPDENDVPVGWSTLAEVIAQGANVDPASIFDLSSAVLPADVALLIYTSGSTSRPKGVQLVHGDLISSAWGIGERQGATQNDRLWLAVSMFWGFGCSNAWPNMLSHGGCIVLQEHFEAGEALQLIEREKCTLFYGTPNIAQAMHEHPDRPKRDLSSLRSGAALGSEMQMMRVVELGATEICNVYGLTEIYGNSHITDHKDPLDRRLTTVGRAAPSVRERIVDPETGQECAANSVGEIRLKGYVTPGYYKDPKSTAEAMDELGYFKTGDLGFVDADGYLHFRGRIKEVVKTGGMLVSPAEVEMVLMRHQAVRLAFVVGVPDTLRDEILGAVIIREPDQELGDEELIQYCKDRMASYKVPRRIAFCSEPDLPLTTTGKVQRNRIQDRFFPVDSVVEPTGNAI